MSFKLKDWSELSYRDVKSQLESYRENYILKDNNLQAAKAKIVEDGEQE